MGEHGQPVRTQRVDRHDARGERLVDGGYVLLGRREYHRNRLQLDDRYDSGARARMDDVSGIDQSEAGLAGERRAYRRIAQLRLCVVDRALIAFDLRDELIDRRLLRVDLLARREILLIERCVTLQIELRVFQHRLVCGLFRERLVEGRLVGPRIDLGENIALLHYLALSEIDLRDLAVDAAADSHRVVRLDDAQSVEIDGEVGLSNGCDSHRDRRRRRRVLGLGRIRGGALIGAPAQIAANRNHGQDRRDQPAASGWRPF